MEAICQLTIDSCTQFFHRLTTGHMHAFYLGYRDLYTEFLTNILLHTKKKVKVPSRGTVDNNLSDMMKKLHMLKPTTWCQLKEILLLRNK